MRAQKKWPGVASHAHLVHNFTHPASSTTSRAMAALVKTCKTFRLIRGLDWTDVKTKVSGVKFINEDTVVMVFHGPGDRSGHNPKPKKTMLLGSNHSSVIKTCCLYECEPHNDSDVHDTGNEVAIIRAMLKASGNSTLYVVESSPEYSVFRMYTDVVVDVWRSKQSLAQRGFRVSLEFELDGALFVTDGKVNWRIPESLPQMILACVPGASPREAKCLVNQSWNNMLRC